LEDSIFHPSWMISAGIPRSLSIYTLSNSRWDTNSRSRIRC